MQKTALTFYFTFCLFFFVSKLNAQSTIWLKNHYIQVPGSSFSKLDTDTLGSVYNISENRIWKQSQQDGTMLYSFQTLHADSIVSIADAIVDPSGSIFLTGSYNHPGQGRNIVTIKYDIYGDIVWSAVFNGTLNNVDAPTAITTDLQGNILITGYTNENVAGNATTVDAITIKYSPAGVQLWAIAFNGLISKRDKANDIVTDNSDNVYIVGSTEDYYSPDSAVSLPYLPNPFPSRKMFLLKYTSQGVFQWVSKNASNYQGNWNNYLPHNFLYYNYDEAYLLEFAANSLYVVYDQYSETMIATNGIVHHGWSGTVNHGANTRINPYLIRYDLTGNILASSVLNSISNSYPPSRTIKKIQSDNSGNIYIKRLQIPWNNGDVFIAKYSPTLSLLFSKPFSGNSCKANFDLDQQHLYIASFRQINVNGPKMDSITRYDLAGTKQWSVGYGSGFLQTKEVAIDNFGDPYVLHSYNTSTNNYTQKFCNTVPTINLGPDITICPNDTVSLNPIATGVSSPGTVFRWNTSVGVSDSTILNPLLFPQITTTYTVKAILRDGCFGTDQIKIKVPSSSHLVNICTGESYEVNGHSYSSPGDYTDTVFRGSGLCDSLIYTHLSIKKNTSKLRTLALCSGDSVYLAGNYQTQVGFYVDSLQSVYGCDSIITTELIAHPNFSQTFELEMCEGDSSFFYGSNHHIGGNYLQTYQSVFGCDSIINYHLVVHPTFSLTTNLSICEDDSVLIFGLYQHLPGTYSNSLQTINGCDSIEIVNLQVNPRYNYSSVVEICSGDSILIGNTYQFQSGIYVDSLQSIFGCDSILSTTLAVHPSYDSFFNLEICEGDSIDFFGSYHHESGTYNQLFQTVFGCDSSVTYQLIVHPVYTTTNNLYICSGDSILIFGNYQSQADTYIDSLQSINGCDSIQIIQLHVNTSYHQQLSLEICEGDSALLFNQYQTIAGIYRDSLQTIEGCDSITEVNLIVHPSFDNQFDLYICQGDSIPIFGQYQSVAGVFIDHSMTAYGCDSISSVTLNVYPSPLHQLPSIHLCDGDSSFIFGQYEFTSGLYYDTLQTVNGCDSILAQELDITTFDHVTTEYSNGVITATPSGLNYSWFNCLTDLTIPGQINSVFTPASGGTYAAIGQLNGCIDTSDCFIDYVEIDEYEQYHVSLFPNPATDKITIDLDRITGTTKVVIASLSGEVVMTMGFDNFQTMELDIAYLASGNYLVSIISDHEISRHELIILP